MVSIEDIPLEKRWEIAARSASAMPLMYDMVFRKAIGRKYDEIERQIWVDGGRELKTLAESLGLPSENAREVGEAFGVVGTILYGPEFRFEVVEEAKDRAVSRVTGCPVLNRAKEMGLDPEIVALRACEALGKSAIESLNPMYTRRLETSMCAGSDYCESVIERRE